MKYFKRIFDFYLDASIHVALAVFSLVQITGIIFSVSINCHLVYVLFFATICCYNFIKYGVEAKKYILVANQYHKSIQVFSFVAFGIALYHAYFLSYKMLIALFCLALLSLLYVIPVWPTYKNLRSWGGFKIVVVALVWAGVTVLVPMLDEITSTSWDIYVEAFQRFVLVLIVLIPFEIRDLQYDSDDLRTLPQQFGVMKTKVMGSFATILFFFLTFLKDEILPKELILKGVLFLTLGMVMYSTKRMQSKYFASFWVESIPIFWWLLFVMQAPINSYL